jgi:TRAP transporter 4TM/12TM fusion protein
VRWGIPDTGDLVFGVIAIALALEACRRVLGLLLPALCLLLIAYALLGPWFPGLARHQGLGAEDLVAWLYSSEAIYGTIARVFATFVFLFIVFGACLEMSGGRNLFLNLPLALLGRTRGGAAKVSIVASVLFGTISGSAAANVVTTGALTIPLMKRSGFPPHADGAFEASASTIGITMPPIMGAAIFVMADFTGISYLEIVKVSVIPAALFILSLLAVADLYARKLGLRALSREEVGRPWEIVRTYWPFLVPLVVLVWFLIGGYSPNLAVFWALPAIVLASLVSPQTRMSPAKWLRIIVTGTRRSLAIGALAGCLGIIVGIVVKTGMATKLSYIVIDLSMGSLILGILLTALVTFLLGMGISSVTADYILLSVLVAPALTELGAGVMAAHLLIIWYTQTSNLTPPVCTVAFASAAVARSAPWQTGLFAFRIGLFLYLIPIAFVTGDLLNLDEPAKLAWSTFTTGMSAIAFAGTVVGYILGPLRPLARVLLGVATVALYDTGTNTDWIGLALMGLVLAWQFAANRRAAPATGYTG